MDYLDAAMGMAGRSRLEGSPARNVTNAHVVRGVAMGDSMGGTVLVDLGGDVTTGDDSQWVEIQTDAAVLEGDSVDVLLVGEPGRAMTPLAVGVPGGGDRQQARIDAAADAANEAMEGVVEASGAAILAQEMADSAQQQAEDALNALNDYTLITDFNLANATIQELTRRLIYGNDDQGNPYIMLQPDPEAVDGISLRLTNDRISFFEGGNEVAYISDSQLYITQGKVVNTQDVGSWRWRERGNGHLTLTYEGVTS